MRFLKSGFLVALVLTISFGGIRGQVALDNKIMPWSGKQGLMMGFAADEAGVETQLTYVRMGLRLGWQAGFGIPLRPVSGRSPGLGAAVFFYPNPFHSRMDPFLHTGLHITQEQGSYTLERFAHAARVGRPQALLLRFQAGYGFNVNLSKYLWLQHRLGLGAGLEFYRDDAPLDRVTLCIAFGVGYHLVTRIIEKRRHNSQGH